MKQLPSPKPPKKPFYHSPNSAFFKVKQTTPKEIADRIAADARLSELFINTLGMSKQEAEALSATRIYRVQREGDWKRVYAAEPFPSPNDKIEPLSASRIAIIAETAVREKKFLMRTLDMSEQEVDREYPSLQQSIMAGKNNMKNSTLA